MDSNVRILLAFFVFLTGQKAVFGENVRSRAHNSGMIEPIQKLFISRTTTYYGYQFGNLQHLKRMLQDWTIWAITFNTALYDYSPEPDIVDNNREQRLQATIGALRNSRADFICLQEVWIGQDLETIVNQLSDIYPHSFSHLHNIDGTLPQQANVQGAPPCSRQPAVDLEQCSRISNCTNSNNRLEFACTAERCPSQLFAILLEPQVCISCIFASSESSVLALVRCSSASSTVPNPRRMNTDGLALLSKRPLTNTQSFKFYSGVTVLNDKGYIKAKFDGDLHVVCTHLTALLSGFTEPFLSQQFPTYADQNRHEVDVITQQFGHVTPLVLLGDMNIGDTFTNTLLAILPRTYNKLKLVFQTTLPSRTCTFCGGDRNPYNVGDTSKSIDHIFGNGIKIVGAKTILTLEDEYVTDLVGRRFPLSDHYGVECVFRYPCSC